jgi:serine/threonine-protein kinase
MEMPEKIGKYEVIQQIGVGGFGVIFKGWDPYIKRPVAIKMCATPDEEVRQRFQREAEFAGNLAHPNITLIFDFGLEGDIPYLVQEFLSGFDLDEMIKARIITDPVASVSILLQVSEGMSFAHQRGIIHRDIKPSNIRVLEDGTVKIMDFGIAKSLEGGTKLTQTGIALGTAGYLAPEQIQGKPVDPRTDIFSLGVVGYELMTGLKPFEGTSLSNVLYKILNEDPEPPIEVATDCPPRLDELIRKCLSKDPEARFQSVAEISDQLREMQLVQEAGSGTTEEIAVTVLREVMGQMKLEKKPGGEVRTTDMAVLPKTRATDEPRLAHTPTFAEHKESRRNPVLVTFVVLLVLVLGGAAAVYLVEEVQNMVFPEGAPWVPTPTPVPPTPTPTPTPTPIPPTPTPTPTLMAVAEPTPAPQLVSVRLVVEPPAIVKVNGKPLKEPGKKTSIETIGLLPGYHTFALSMPDYPRSEIEIGRRISESTNVIPLNIELGQISIFYEEGKAISGGVAYLNGDEIGTVPQVNEVVPAGEHKLVVRWGDSKIEKDINITSSKPAVVFVAPPE